MSDELLAKIDVEREGIKDIFFISIHNASV
jgi:hypothetical protein